MTPPMEPVVIVADAVLQEEPIPEADRGRLHIPKLTLASPPAGDYGAVKEAAKMLVARRESGHRRRPRGAHSGRHRLLSNWPRRCRPRSSIATSA